MTLPLFAYGTLRMPEIQWIFFARKFSSEVHILNGHRPAFNGDFLNVIDHQNSRTEGVLLNLSPREWKICDLWEDHPELYQKKVVEVFSENLPDQSRQALCYHCDIPEDRHTPLEKSGKFTKLGKNELFTLAKEFISQIPPDLLE